MPCLFSPNPATFLLCRMLRRTSIQDTISKLFLSFPFKLHGLDDLPQIDRNANARVDIAGALFRGGRAACWRRMWISLIRWTLVNHLDLREGRREGLGNREGRVGARCVERRWWFEKLDDEGIGEERVWSCKGFCGLEGREEGVWFCHLEIICVACLQVWAC
jgi:hypothetical protein